MNTLMELTLGERLKILRERKGKIYTLDKVSNDLNMSKTTLHAYENNLTKPSADNLKKLAEYYNVTIDYLVTGEENLTKEQIIDKIKDEKVNLMFEAGANELSKEGLQSVLDYIKFVKYRDQQENQEKK